MKRTTTEAELRDLRAQGKTIAEIGKLLGRHPVTVSAALSVLGLTGSSNRCGKGPNGAHVAPPVMAYLAGLRKGMTTRELAEQHQRTQGAVVAALKRHGLPTSARQLLRAEAAQSA